MSNSNQTSRSHGSMQNNPKNVKINEKDIIKLFENHGLKGMRPNDLSLYQKAFVHKSYVKRASNNSNCLNLSIPLQSSSYERLEFLGDSVLNLIVAKYLFIRFPDEKEGFLTRLRTKIVNGTMLSLLSERLGLLNYVLLTKQAEDQGLRQNTRLSEDIFEALLGSIFLDIGYEAAEIWMIHLMENYIDFGSLVLTM